MWLKIYFWIYFILSAIGFGYMIKSPSLYSGGGIAGVVFTSIFMIGLFCYVYKKRLFSNRFWKVIFWILVFFFIECILEVYIIPKDFIDIYLPFFKSILSTNSSGTVISWLANTPILYFIFQLSIEKKK